jgi:hypothetical protein
VISELRTTIVSEEAQKKFWRRRSRIHFHGTTGSLFPF